MRGLIHSGPGRFGAAAVAALALAGAAGCDSQEDADLERGRALFVENCGTCHSLAEAATTAQVGPDLDASFAGARRTGMDQDTIEGVVQNQIAVPRKVDQDDPDYAQVYMPADLVTGQDAEDVSAYVASVAGIPGIAPPEAPGGEGGQVFANNGCASCHTLEAAGAAGNVGPNLDESLAGQTEKSIEQSIVDPNAEIVSGFPANVMPSYEGEIPEDELQALVEFLFTSTNKGG